MPKFCLFLLLCITPAVWAQGSYDIVIVGGTPGGITAAIAAAREGKTSVLLERTNHVGGLPANGLGATDIGTRGATTGLFKEFVDALHTHYLKTYGTNSPQVRASSGGYHFEPSLAEATFTRMLREHRDKITVLTLHQFDAAPENIIMADGVIRGIRVLNRKTRQQQTFTGKIFIDATYEGDLGAAAGAPFRVGREGRDEFGEAQAGVIYRYWKHGPDGTGSTYAGDDAVQAYNYRLCLTSAPANRRAITKPKNYNREEYASLVDDVLLGRHTGVVSRNITAAQREENRRHILDGNKTKIKDDPWGIWKITNMVTLPNGKTDANNQHMAFLSTDLPEENYPWPTASWEWRDQFAERLRDYILGLIWFSQNDPALPKHFREAAAEWGLAKDEYTDNNNFPRQVYVREGRRFEGEYFFTAKDAIPVASGQRPPLHADSVTASHYALDSHATRKREPDRVHLEGFFSAPTAVYTVPFGVIVPKQVKNLLIPVPVSGSHVGFSTLRMEPCWMALGQAAGIAASLAIDERCRIKQVPVPKLQNKLVAQQATLVYFKDVPSHHADFAMVQFFGLRGYLSHWEADLGKPLDDTARQKWEKLSGHQLSPKAATRRDALAELYQALDKE